MEPQVSIYDEVAFPSYPYPQSHPERLATMARLCGVATASPHACRLLELGCGAGGNLLPMADGLPNSQFLGIDLSEQQIAIGNEWRASAGLSNVQLVAADILDLDQTLGPFDFIIVHGVYSWTTDDVRDKILQLCGELLAPQGMAYVNFNTYPGWHLQGMLRDMLQLHTRGHSRPEDRVRAARSLIEFLDVTLPLKSTPLGSLLRQELDAIRRYADRFLFHAYLNVVNYPLQWREFVDRAAVHGLRYVTDADPATAWPERANSQLLSALQKLEVDRSQWSQYADFARCTSSRRSLLCRGEFAVDPGPRTSELAELQIAAPLRPAGIPTAAGTSFTTSTGRTVTTNDPGLIATLDLLARTWPQSIAVAQLKDLVANQLALNAVPESWNDEILRLFCSQIVELTVDPPRGSTAISEFPRVSPLVREQARRNEFVVNSRHEPVQLSEPDRRVLASLDGTRSAEQLSRELGPDVRETLIKLNTSALLG